MNHKIRTALLTAATLVLFSYSTSLATGLQANRNSTVKGEMKTSGHEVGKAGSSLGSNVKHGRVARGGKHFGKHMYSAGKHFGKGTGKAAQKTGHAIKNAAKP